MHWKLGTSPNDTLLKLGTAKLIGAKLGTEQKSIHWKLGGSQKHTGLRLKFTPTSNDTFPMLGNGAKLTRLKFGGWQKLIQLKLGTVSKETLPKLGAAKLTKLKLGGAQKLMQLKLGG